MECPKVLYIVYLLRRVMHFSSAGPYFVLFCQSIGTTHAYWLLTKLVVTKIAVKTICTILKKGEHIYRDGIKRKGDKI